VRTKYGDRPCLASNFLPGTYRDYLPTLVDGSALPTSLLTEVAQVADRIAVDIAWSAGEIAIIDNSRCLHARRSQDQYRKVWGVFGSATF
jgi:alpha-ketoglutarate-dependent taurine dioxygenase